MHTTTLVAKKGSFKMDAKRPGLHLLAIARCRCLNRIGKSLKRHARRVKRSRNGSWKIAGYSMLREKVSKPRQFGDRRTHEVDSGAAMDVNVEKAWRQYCVVEIDNSRARGNFLFRT